MSNPSILSVILNYRTPRLTLRSAEAALREMRKLGGEVLIIDNASGDGSAKQIEDGMQARGWNAAGDICLIRSGENRGFGAGNNMGIRLGLASGARPDFVYLLNSDAWPDEGAVGVLLKAMQDNPRAGLAGSHIRGEDDTTHCTVFRFPSIASEFQSAARTGFITRMLKHAVVPMEIPTQTTRVDWTAGASMLLRQDMLDQIGGFDEAFFLYFEETELCHRAARAGWDTLYVPDSRAVHVGSVSTGRKTWTRMPRYWFASRSHYFTKVHGRPYAALATLARVAGGLIWQARRLLSRKPPADPPRFLRDLIAYSLVSGRIRGSNIPGGAMPMPRTEDSK